MLRHAIRQTRLSIFQNILIQIQDLARGRVQGIGLATRGTGLVPVLLYRATRTLAPYQPYSCPVSPVQSHSTSIPMHSPTRTLVPYHLYLPAVPTLDIPSRAWLLNLYRSFHHISSNSETKTCKANGNLEILRSKSTN